MHKCHPPVVPKFGTYCPPIIGISRLLKRDVHNTLSANGLFPGQDYIIMIIGHNQGITPSQLAQQMNVSLATISVSVKRMEKSGFIEKKPDENDARTNHLYLTEKAQNVSSNVRSRLKKQDEILVQGMTEDEKAVFLSLLNKALNNISGEVKPEDEN